nr:transposase [Aquabacterium sp.]
MLFHHVELHGFLRSRSLSLLCCHPQSRRMTDQVEGIKASIHAKVEHPFRVIKRQFGHVKVRYRGLAKNTAQLQTLFAQANLWMVRRRLSGSLA